MYPTAVMLLFMAAALATIRPSNQAGIFDTTWHVHVVNGLSNNKVLFVHCKSGNDDLGEHNLTAGTETNWKFKLNFFGSTVFGRYASPNTEQKHASFEVFRRDDNLLYKCNYSECIWTAKDDGIYLKNIPENKDEFKYHWRQGRVNDHTNQNFTIN